MIRNILSYLLILLNAMLITIMLFHDQLIIPKGILISGRLHPMLIHLPIGFLLQTLLIRWVKNRMKFNGIDRLLDYSFLITALLTVCAALAGCILATEEGYSAELITRHLYSGTALSLTVLALFYLQSNSQFFKPIAFISILLLVLTGHFGSSITHGENFLSPISSDSGNKILIPDDSITVFEAVVNPIIDKKCIACHNSVKKKGGLDMSTWENLSAGGKHGAIWIPGKPKSSEIMKRLNLPLEDEKHMPPNGKNQMTYIEKKLVELFIQSGGNINLKFKTLDQSDSLRVISSYLNQNLKNSDIHPIRDLDPISAEQLAKLNNTFRNVSQLALNDPGLRVGFFMPTGFDENALGELHTVAENIIELYLSGMPVNSDLLYPISNFKNLEILFLNNTTLNDETIKIIGTLPKLRKLSVSNTQLTLNGLKFISEHPSLKEVSAWSIRSSQDALHQAKDLNPKINWIFGEKGNSKEFLKLTPPISLNENRILKQNEKIIFKHNLPGVTIRYTMSEENDPDSITGYNYTKPLSPAQFTKIKLIAIKNGWKSSSVSEFSFFTSGIKPINAKLLSSPAKDYRSEGVTTLTDSKAGDQDNHRDGQWLGFRDHSLNAIFEFNEENLPGSITISYLKNTGAYILPPQIIKIYGGEQINNLMLIAEKKPTQPNKYDQNVVLGESIKLSKQHRFIRVEIESVGKLPSWHSGKGQRGWIFIDELFFYSENNI